MQMKVFPFPTILFDKKLQLFESSVLTEICAIILLSDRIRNSDSTILLGHAVAQLVEALRYEPEGRGFDSRWCHWNFSLT